jgi:hypothetical protein
MAKAHARAVAVAGISLTTPRKWLSMEFVGVH